MEALLLYLTTNIPLLPALIYANLEYVVAGVGGIGVAVYMKTKKVYNHSNDLTNLIVKQKKYCETVNKRVK